MWQQDWWLKALLKERELTTIRPSLLFPLKIPLGLLWPWWHIMIQSYIRAFLNGDLDEEVYVQQPQGFVKSGKEHLVCKLKKSTYDLKQALQQWYLKFDEIITTMGFVKNKVDPCRYLKVSESCFYVHYSCSLDCELMRML